MKRFGGLPSILSLGLCLAALAVYLTVPPSSVHAFSCGSGECVYAGQCYSNGACRPNQRCEEGNWVDDSQCVK